MPKTAHVRPTGGRKIRYPERPSQILADTGAIVPLTDYWAARIATGDVVLADPVSPASATSRQRRPSSRRTTRIKPADAGAASATPEEE